MKFVMRPRQDASLCRKLDAQWTFGHELRNPANCGGPKLGQIMRKIGANITVCVNHVTSSAQCMLRFTSDSSTEDGVVEAA